MEEVDHVFSLVVVGDSKVGKTTLLTRFEKDEFLNPEDATISGLMTSFIVKIEKCLVRLNIWDTTGVDDYKELNSCHFADAQGCIFLYSMNDQKSFKNILYKWKTDFDKDSLSPHVFFLVGTKYDLPSEENTVEEDEIKETAATLDAQSFYVSSLSGAGISDLKEYIAQHMVAKLNPKPTQKPKNAEIRNEPETKNSKALKKKAKKQARKEKKHNKNCLIC